ncbi:Gfo/Idh/MocA family protein [Streptomyces sp. NBC_01465]|uniref:Gfo/Idh/MocA family protein n=1 Tax=Streptomyces sp. NBC_01465 TaxID=2903878 RepID=UPI003255FBF0
MATIADVARRRVQRSMVELGYHPNAGAKALAGRRSHITALVTLLGPVRKVVGMTSASRSERTVGHGPRAGTTFPVEVATHVAGVLEHASGALSTLVMSFDVWAAGLPHIEIYGTEGSLSVPDPNHFDGPVRLFRAGAETKDWEDVPVRVPKPDSRSTSPAPPCGPLPYRRTRAGRSPRTPAADTEEAKEHAL